VISHLADKARDGTEIWGCDIDAPAIEWCQKNMMPPFRFFANSTAPHLPFRDDYFDFIYAGSVINHIKDMATFWVMEIGRCIRPGGLFIPTIIDKLSIPLLEEIYKKDPACILPKHVVENGITVDMVKNIGFINRYSTTSP
jgi:SAM-dependent methyltransferase